MRFILVILVFVNFSIANSFAENEVTSAYNKDYITCSFLKILANSGEDNHIKNLALLYAFGSICEQNYIESLKCYQTLSRKNNVPMYSLKSPLSVNAERAKTLIHQHNGIFGKKIFELEETMINFLKYYNDGLGQIFTSYSIRAKSGSLDNRPMLNDHGSASTSYCQLDIENQVPLLLHTHPPDKNDVVVVDIGSGWGACSKQLALLGYKVYSIDKDQRHLKFQEDNFCTMPAPDTFLYHYWKVHNPAILEKQKFKHYCYQIKDKNIVYIAGNFTDEKIINQLKQKQWNIVLSLDSLQFMNPKDREDTFKLINKHIQNKGIFILKTKRKNDYSSDNLLIYDFDLHHTFYQIFIDYKVLSSLIVNNKILGLTLYKH